MSFPCFIHQGIVQVGPSYPIWFYIIIYKYKDYFWYLLTWSWHYLQNLLYPCTSFPKLTIFRTRSLSCQNSLKSKFNSNNLTNLLMIKIGILSNHNTHVWMNKQYQRLLIVFGNMLLLGNIKKSLFVCLCLTVIATKHAWINLKKFCIQVLWHKISVEFVNG